VVWSPGGKGQHGFARTKSGSLKEVVPAPDGSVAFDSSFPNTRKPPLSPAFQRRFRRTVNDALNLELKITITSKDEILNFENCLHTYFEVGDISTVSFPASKASINLDKTANFAAKTGTNDSIRISSEVDGFISHHWSGGNPRPRP